MKILAIDTSCDESCAAIIDVDRWVLLSDVVHSHVDRMTKFGGVVPEIASREHLKGLPLVVQEAVASANLTLDDIDWFTVTNRPGLIGALLVGVSFTKALAFALNKPFTALNHVEAHLYSPLLATFEGSHPPPFPWIALVVSGGHSELFLVRDFLSYEWLGGTLDDAAGEAFDKVGKLLQLPYPAGPRIDRWVKESATAADRVKFAFPRAKTDGFHFSFSGLKTAVSNQIRKLGAFSELSENDKLAVAASAQEAILDPLVEKLQRAQTRNGVAQSVITGGVACNSRLREKLPGTYFPTPRHCTDNAAMVALLAGLRAKRGELEADPWSTTAFPSVEFPQGGN